MQLPIRWQGSHAGAVVGFGPGSSGVRGEGDDVYKFGPQVPPGIAPRKYPRGILLIASALAASGAVMAALGSGLNQVAIIAVSVALIGVLIAPEATFAAAILWIILCRTSVEVFPFEIGGFHLTEVDLLPALAMLAAVRSPSSAERFRLAPISWFFLAIWPIWYALRFLLPTIGADVGSAAVDARNFSMYLVAFPITIYISKRGPSAGVRLLAYGGYLACGIALGAWLLLMAGYLKPALTSFVYFYAVNDVRPGGEVLVVILAVMFALGKAPLVFGSRWLSLSLILGELLVSQTLSMVVAIVTGVAAGTLLRWRTLGGGKKVAAALVAAIFVALAVGGVAQGSRFDLQARIDEASAEYRGLEFDQVTSAITASPLSIAIGNGPGSVISVPNVYTHEVDVKRDTHDVFANIAFKSGLIGLVLYLALFGHAILSLMRSRSTMRKTMPAAFIALIVLSVTVPFLWTASGASALILLYVTSMVQLSSSKSYDTALADRSLEVHERSGALHDSVAREASQGAHPLGPI